MEYQTSAHALNPTGRNKGEELPVDHNGYVHHLDHWESLEEFHKCLHESEDDVMQILHETVGQGNQFDDHVAHKLFAVATKKKEEIQMAPIPIAPRCARSTTEPVHTFCNQCCNNVDENYTLGDWEALPGVAHELPKKCAVIPDDHKVPPAKLFGAASLAKVLSATLQQYSKLKLLTLTVVDLCGMEYPFGVGTKHPYVDDKTFANQRLNGPNPMALEKIDNIATMKKRLEAAELPKNDLNEVLDACETAFESGKLLYVMDYLFLKKYVNTKNDLNGQIPATFAIFTYDDELLVPLRIVVRGPYNLARKAAPGDNAWQFAKRCVQCSDLNVHELKYHLHDTHLVAELILVATKRILAPANHFIDFLLKPTFENTLSLNDGARTSLLPALTKMCGTDLQTLQEIVGISFATYDFVGSYPRNDLQKRGLLKGDQVVIPGYYYAKDALFLWDQLYAFFEAVVKIEYPENRLFYQDKALKCWVKYIQEVGGLKTFPTLNEPEDLVNVLTMILFITSVQHSAVNYEQARYFGYVENAPAAIYNWKDLDWNNVNAKVMNHVDPARRMLQREFVKMLSQPPADEQTLLSIVEDHYTKYDEPRDKLLAALEQFSREVRKRKKACDYVVLNPDRCETTLAAGIYI